MTDFQKEYYKTKVMQSMGLIDNKLNPVDIADEKIQYKKTDNEQPGSKEFENHMVVGEYYNDK